MNSLKFLGHPAPKVEHYDYFPATGEQDRITHLEGAIKEFLELNEKDKITLNQTAFLLRKTLGEVEQKK